MKKPNKKKHKSNEYHFDDWEKLLPDERDIENISTTKSRREISREAIMIKIAECKYRNANHYRGKK